MGATSSTETKTNYVTGETKTKHKLGGSYPGNRRKANAPYAPPASQFSGGQATAHFVSYGGGNALVLKEGGTAQPQMGAAFAKPPEYIQVTLPPGVEPGQTIRVAAPDGRLNEIVIPPGFGPGSTFTVEFADPDSPPKQEAYSSYDSRPAVAAPVAAGPPPRVNDDDDDGFATGFNKPSGDVVTIPSRSDYSNYPSATDARPVYPPYGSQPY